MAANHVDGEAQMPFGTGQKQLRIVRFTHRTGRHRTYPAGLETAQFFAEPRQRLPTAIQRQRIQRAAVQTFGKTHRFAQGFHFLNQEAFATAHRLADHQAKGIRTQVDGSEQRGVFFHGNPCKTTVARRRTVCEDSAVILMTA